MKRILYFFFAIAPLFTLAQSPYHNDVVRTMSASTTRTANALDAAKAYNSSGTNTYTFTGFSAYTAYHVGDQLTFTFVNANTSTTCSANVNGIGAIALKDNAGNDFAVDDLKAGSTHKFIYNGTNFRMIGGAGGGGGWALSGTTTITGDVIIDGSSGNHNAEFYFDSFVMSTPVAGFGFDATGADITGDVGFAQLRAENGANDVLIRATPTMLTLDSDDDMEVVLGDNFVINGDVGTTGEFIGNVNGTLVWATPSGGSGTVTSVAATVPSFLSISGSPVTTSGTLAISLSGTALPVANGGTGITSFAANVATFLGTSSSANFAAALTDESGTGVVAFTTSPTFTTPNLGTPSAITLNASNLLGMYVWDQASTSTAGGTITLDMNSQKARMFVGSATFSGAKAIALSNTTNSLVWTFDFNVTSVAAVITPPTDWYYEDINFNGTTWTPPSTGRFSFAGRWDATNSEWRVVVRGPFNN